ncbi:hypothetical protein ACFQS7_20485 [Dankookia sp. GCM10030260]|uniref:hypothetical protein n=1 Tax=Dankookia sp. GCM10030260 TaxID=3273390 RepID=UPI00360A28B6
MPQSDNEAGAIAAQAAALAEELAPELDAVLLTHFPDADTLDTLRPGGPDLATTRAVNRAVAEALAAQGVEIFAQAADRGAFRRWLADRRDTPEVRRAWVDRGRVLSGAAAHTLLGIAPPAPPPAPAKFPQAPGPVADRLLALLDADDGAAVDELTQALLTAGRGDILDLAIRKIGQRYGEDASEELEADLLAAAEGARMGPSGWAELVALPVALPPDSMPDAAAMGESLVQAGLLAETLEVRFLPGWRSPEALEALSPVALRRVLLDLLAGQEPRDLPPGDTDDLRRRGFGLLLGLQIDWAIPSWETITADGPPEQPEEDEEGTPTPEQARRAALFDGWRGAVFEASGGGVPLALVPASEVGAEIAEFLEEAGGHVGGLEEIREFVAMARNEAGGEDVVCRPEVIGDSLELALYAESGRFLDSLTLPAKRLPARAEEMPRLIEGFVRVVRDAPGR